MANTKPKGGLTAWFGKGKKGDWVDIGAPKKKGRYQDCWTSTNHTRTLIYHGDHGSSHKNN